MRGPALGILCLALATTGFASDPFYPSQRQQVQLGKKAAQQLRSSEKILPATDPRVVTLRRVARRLLSTFSDPKSPWEYSFDVIEKRDVNAFALPGGATFFYTGLLNKMSTEDELASVLGHELTHVRKEHWAHAYADSQSRNILLTIGLILARANRNVVDFVNLGNEVVFNLRFSRKHETQADEGGLEMMSSAGYNPRGMVDMFQILRDQSKGDKPPEFFSDHPDDKNRIRHIEELIAKSHRTYPGQTPLRWPKFKDESGPKPGSSTGKSG